MSVMKLQNTGLRKIRETDERLVSYNIEMTEVTGGTFWKKYTPGQIAGTEEFQMLDPWDFQGMMQWYDPIDLKEETIRHLAKALGSCYIRVSGSWATSTYYDFDGQTGGEIPQGFRALLTKEQWNSLLDFVKAVDGKLLISMSNCDGIHSRVEPWHPELAKQILDYSRDYGVPVCAAEFVNESNTLSIGGMPEGYTAEDYAADQDRFYRFMRENYPDTLLVGPCGCLDDIGAGKEGEPRMGAMFQAVPTESILELCEETPDVFSYHCYNGVSERGAAMGGHWLAEDATSEAYLAVAGKTADYYSRLREKNCPGVPMWVTESADAGSGGSTWASTYLDVIRTIDELGSFAAATDGVIFHNTLASSDYGFLDPETHLPRPNYWAVYLWNQIMGTTVYDSKIALREGAHVYAHSRRDGKDGYAYAVINNSRENAAVVELPGKADVYLLDAEDLRSPIMRVNGTPAALTVDGAIPNFEPVKMERGELTLPPVSVAYVVL